MTVLADVVRGHPRHVVLGALASGLALGWRSPVLLLALLVAAAGLTLLVKIPLRLALALAAALIVGSLIADLRLTALDRSQLAPKIGHALRGPVTFTQAPRLNRFGWWAIAQLDGEPVLVRGSGRAPPLAIGDVVDVAGSLRPLTSADQWLAVQHVRAILKLRAISAVRRRRGGVAGQIDRIRTRATTALSVHLPPTQAGLLRGMTLGDDSAMPTALRDAMRRSGLGHLVAASGANVALLVVLVFVVGALLGAPRSARLVVALLAVALYIPLAGAGPSIQRAGVIGVAGLVAGLASRPSSRWYALLLAAAVTLMLDPLAGEQPGWQLSFAAVAAIGLLVGPLRALLKRRSVPSIIGEPLALTIAATLGSAPVAAAAFGTLSLVSVPANLAAALLVAPVTWLGMVAALVGQVSAPLAAPLAWLAYWPLTALGAIAQFSAGLPAAQIDASALPVTLCCVGAALLVRFRRARRYALPAGAAGAVLIALLLVEGRPATLAAPPSGTVRISFLDVGQGDATLLQSGGQSALIDSGPPDGPIVARLREAGIDRLDLLVATHAQADHLGGADKVLDAIPVAALLDGRDGLVEAQGMEMADSARRHRVPLLRPVAGDSLTIGSLRLEIRSPPGNSRPLTGADPNQRAVVIFAAAPGIRLLLTADAESDVLAPLDLPPIDVLKISHHGSADPGLPALLERLQPRVAVIEVGAGNSYGHPTAPTLAALVKAAVPTWRTDKDGTVRIDVDSAGLHVQRAT